MNLKEAIEELRNLTDQLDEQINHQSMEQDELLALMTEIRDLAHAMHSWIWANGRLY